MKKQVITLMLLSLLYGITACQEEISSSSIGTSSFSSNPVSSPLESSAVSGPSSSISYSYQPIGKSTNLDIFSNPIKFELTTTKIDKDAAENLINTDVNKFPEGRVLTKTTSIKNTRRESHVTVNRTTILTCLSIVAFPMLLLPSRRTVGRNHSPCSPGRA